MVIIAYNNHCFTGTLFPALHKNPKKTPYLGGPPDFADLVKANKTILNLATEGRKKRRGCCQGEKGSIFKIIDFLKNSALRKREWEA